MSQRIILKRIIFLNIGLSFKQNMVYIFENESFSTMFRLPNAKFHRYTSCSFEDESCGRTNTASPLCVHVVHFV
jgi:hypothetical protein